MLVGEMEVIVGIAFPEAIVKTAAFEEPPPGAGLTTVMFAVPVLEMFKAGTWAVSSVALT
jgi:hypothetical protein